MNIGFSELYDFCCWERLVYNEPLLELTFTYIILIFLMYKKT